MTVSASAHVRGALAFVVAVLALAPSGAHAGVGSLGTGRQPALAMDSVGTAYIAWNGLENVGASSLTFCRLPRGATACEKLTPISAPGQHAGQPFVALAGDTVRVLSHRFGGDVPGFAASYLFVSNNRGDSFTNSGQVGTVPFHAAEVGPGAGISLVTSAFSGGGVYQRVPTDGSPKVETSAVLSGTHLYDGAVGLADLGTPVVTYAQGDGQGKVWRCENCTGGKNPNDLSNWVGGTDIGNADDAHMAGGPSGLFLKSSDQFTGGNLIVRKYGGGTFGAPVTVPDSTGEHPQSHMTQDPAGRLHVLWPRLDADAIRLYYAISDDGVNWLQGGLVAGSEVISQVRTAAAPDHIGLAVWDTGGGANSQVRIRQFGPTPPTTQPPTQPPSTFPPLFAGPFQQVTISDRFATFTLFVPRSCVHPGQKFRVRFRWRKKRLRRNPFVRVHRADFYFGSKRVKKDRKAPFAHVYTMPATQPPGSKVKVRVRAFLKFKGQKKKHKRKRTRSIRKTIRVCTPTA